MHEEKKFDPALTTRLDFTRTTSELVADAKNIGSATLHEAAGRIGALPSQIHPIHPEFALCGPAATVNGPPGDNLWLHRAIYAAQPGDVLVADVSGGFDFGYWGEVMSTAAQARGLAGLVLNGCVRDYDLLGEIGFPIFARGLCIRGTGKDFGARGWINHPVLLDDIVVNPGDLILGDADGVVAIPQDRASETISASRKREAYEADICRKLVEGATTLELFGWT